MGLTTRQKIFGLSVPRLIMSSGSFTVFHGETTSKRKNVIFSIVRTGFCLGCSIPFSAENIIISWLADVVMDECSVDCWRGVWPVISEPDLIHRESMMSN